MEATALRAIRDTVTATLYPGGLPATGADAIDDAAALCTLPPHAGTSYRYTHLQNGGFEPGGSPIYSWLLSPAFNPRGKLILYLGGHTAGWDVIGDSEPIFIDAALAAGFHVLACDMPQRGRNPNYDPNGACVYYQGQRIAYGDHAMGSFDVIVEPNGMRLFLDYPMRGMTQAVADYGLGIGPIVTYSGGWIAGRLLQILDARIATRYSIGGYNPGIHGGYTPNDGEWECYCPILRNAVGGDLEILEPVTVCDGKRAIEILIDRDSIPFIGLHAITDSLLHRYRAQLIGTGGSIEHWYDVTAPEHGHTLWSANAILTDIEAHL